MQVVFTLTSALAKHFMLTRNLYLLSVRHTS